MKRIQFKRCFSSIYKAIIESYQNEYCPSLKIKIGKNFHHKDLWVFDENIAQQLYNEIYQVFERLYLASHQQITDCAANITKNTYKQREYEHNGWKTILVKDTKIPIQFKLKGAEYVADFACNKQNIDLRVIKDVRRYEKNMNVNIPCVFEYDSIYEQHISTYCFSNAINVHFIKEFDITQENPCLPQKTIYKIQISFNPNIDFKDQTFEQLFEQICCMVVFEELPKQSYKHTYELIDEYVNAFRV